MYVSEQLASAMQCDTSRETSEALVLHCTSMACTALVGLAVHKYGLPMLAVSQAGERAIAGPRCLTTAHPSVLVPRLPEQHSPLLVDSYTHEFQQQHKMVSYSHI